MTIGFIGNADFFLRFFELCAKYGIDDEKDRVKLLAKMAEKEKGISVFKTSRSKDEIVKDYAKNYGNVLHLKPEED